MRRVFNNKPVRRNAELLVMRQVVAQLLDQAQIHTIAEGQVQFRFRHVQVHSGAERLELGPGALALFLFKHRGGKLKIKDLVRLVTQFSH